MGAILQVECSSLTGESDLVPAPVECKNDIPEQAQCLVFMSTMCMNGEGRGIVVRTGEIGERAVLVEGLGMNSMNRIRMIDGKYQF